MTGPFALPNAGLFGANELILVWSLDKRHVFTVKSPNNKGAKYSNNTLIKKLSYSNVSLLEQLLLHANLKVISIKLPCEQLHV